MKIFFVTIFTVLFFLQSANSQVIDSSFFQWTIYEWQDDEELDEKKCYMVAHPIKTDSSQKYRSESYIMITRYQHRRIEEISVNVGFDYKINSKILLSVDEAKYQLTTNQDMAWARTKNDDVLIIQKMLSSATLKVRADSAIGTFAIDEYSLKGIAKAYSRMREICK